jgi:hypothetical protein
LQRIVGLLLLLLTLGWITSELPSDTPGNEPNSSMAWRRTRDGWQRRYTLVIVHPAPPPQLHPVVVATFEGLLVLTGVVAFSGAGEFGTGKAEFGSRI